MAWKTDLFTLNWEPQPWRLQGCAALCEFGSFAVSYMPFGNVWYASHWDFENRRRTFDEYFATEDEAKTFVEAYIGDLRNGLERIVKTVLEIQPPNEHKPQNWNETVQAGFEPGGIFNPHPNVGGWTTQLK